MVIKRDIYCLPSATRHKYSVKAEKSKILRSNTSKYWVFKEKLFFRTAFPSKLSIWLHFQSALLQYRLHLMWSWLLCFNAYPTVYKYLKEKNLEIMIGERYLLLQFS